MPQEITTKSFDCNLILKTSQVMIFVDVLLLKGVFSVLLIKKSFT